MAPRRGASRPAPLRLLPGLLLVAAAARGGAGLWVSYTYYEYGNCTGALELGQYYPVGQCVPNGLGRYSYASCTVGGSDITWLHCDDADCTVNCDASSEALGCQSGQHQLKACVEDVPVFGSIAGAAWSQYYNGNATDGCQADAKTRFQFTRLGYLASLNSIVGCNATAEWEAHCGNADCTDFDYVDVYEGGGECVPSEGDVQVDVSVERFCVPPAVPAWLRQTNHENGDCTGATVAEWFYQAHECVPTGTGKYQYVSCAPGGTNATWWACDDAYCTVGCTDAGTLELGTCGANAAVSTCIHPAAVPVFGSVQNALWTQEYAGNATDGCPAGEAIGVFHYTLLGPSPSRGNVVGCNASVAWESLCTDANCTTVGSTSWLSLNKCVQLGAEDEGLDRDGLSVRRACVLPPNATNPSVRVYTYANTDCTGELVRATYNVNGACQPNGNYWGFYVCTPGAGSYTYYLCEDELCTLNCVGTSHPSGCDANYSHYDCVTSLPEFGSVADAIWGRDYYTPISGDTCSDINFSQMHYQMAGYDDVVRAVYGCSDKWAWVAECSNPSCSQVERPDYYKIGNCIEGIAPQDPRFYTRLCTVPSSAGRTRPAAAAALAVAALLVVIVLV